jgi:hypothetical protein
MAWSGPLVRRHPRLARSLTFQLQVNFEFICNITYLRSMTARRRLSDSRFLKLEKRVSFDPQTRGLPYTGQAQGQRHFGGMAPACAWEKLLTTSIAIGESKPQSPPCESENESVSVL